LRGLDKRVLGYTAERQNLIFNRFDDGLGAPAEGWPNDKE